LARKTGAGALRRPVLVALGSARKREKQMTARFAVNNLMLASALAAADGWRTVHQGVEVKLTRHPETEETVILCRSDDRRSKERAMHDKFSRRIETALERLAVRVTRSKRHLDPAPVNRQIGRILQQNQRAAARFTGELEPDACPAGFRLHVAYNASFDDWAALS